MKTRRTRYNHRVTIAVDDGMLSALNAYTLRNDYYSLSEAMRDLLEAGLKTQPKAKRKRQPVKPTREAPLPKSEQHEQEKAGTA